jgi:3-hydroxybutyrate dehydrogenase
MLRGKCALITGSTSGLGYAAAVRFAEAGCDVVLNGLAGRDEIEPKRRQLETDHGVRAVFYAADLRDPAQIAGMIDSAEAQFGAVDILVNNAVVRHFAPIDEMKVEDWDEALAVNLSAAFHTIRRVLPKMRARNWGRIINMASIYATIGASDRADYVTTKTALVGLTRAVAHETLKYDITCNALCPGSVLTPAIENRIEDMMTVKRLDRDEAVRRFLAQKQPSGRFVSAESVAAMMVFLCGPGGRDITAAAIPIDAAWSAS